MIPAVEERWPLGQGGYAATRERMADHLRRGGVEPRAFSHFGIVVRDAARALADLGEELGAPWTEAVSRWAGTYGCRIARVQTEGVEFELIEPVGESFLRRHLEEHGEGVQHLSFWVGDIAGCVESLRAAGDEMADPEIRRGLHGSVAFLRPEEFAPLCIELCEPAD